MPELPEVHTTAEGLDKTLRGLKIIDVWTDYDSAYHAGKNNIKNREYFLKFTQDIVGRTIIHTNRRAKNVLIHLSLGKTLLVHMKMTGHLLYGKYIFKKSDKKDPWHAMDEGPLRDDPFNKWIHFVLVLSNGKHVALSDMRKFAKVTLLETYNIENSPDLKNLGPEPLDPSFSFEDFKVRLTKKPTMAIKQALMDQTVIAGIGNIYSDEILWEAGVHPVTKTSSIPRAKLELIFMAMKLILAKGIDFGGDSMSDYRNIHGVRGEFQHKHNAYQRTGEKCRKKGCSGKIARMKIGGRSGHFCTKHQRKF